jgi:hypothetical protein
MNYTPVIIIGAGRSGTNMLRDILNQIPGFHTWDCDEINPIWRYGNKNHPTDELSVEQLTPAIKKYIRKRFDILHKRTNATHVLEKTCANSLRFDYVQAIFPEAKYIVINRDGRDVAPSAKKRWGAKFELSYTLKKLKYVPFIDLPYYVWKFGWNRVKKIVTKTSRLGFWGPVYDGLEKDIDTKSLLEVCALQWKNCAMATYNQRQNFKDTSIYDLNYESFVTNPNQNLKSLISFLEIDDSILDYTSLTAKVSSRSVGSHKKLNQEDIEMLNQVCSSTLTRLDYTID